MSSLREYLARYATAGRPGVAALRDLLDHIDPVHAARSTLEVKTRRLLVAHGITGFVREFPLTWNRQRYLYDFAFPARRTILETNGRRWHDDAADYERDNEKWSVPGRHGYRLVFATWDKVAHRPHQLLAELDATLDAQAGVSPKRARTSFSIPRGRWRSKSDAARGNFSRFFVKSGIIAGWASTPCMTRVEPSAIPRAARRRARGAPRCATTRRRPEVRSGTAPCALS